MSQHARHLKIGLFVLGSFAVLIAALLGFGLRRSFERRQRFETYVKDVGDLGVGAAVKLNGVPVGEVTHLTFSWLEYPGGSPQCVVVHFEMRASVNPTPRSTAGIEQLVRQGLRAVIATQGLAGSSYLALETLDRAATPPLPYTWKPHSFPIPSAESRISHILESIDRTLSNLDKIDMARVDRMLDAADRTLRNLSELDAKGLSERLGAAASGTQQAALQVQALAREARGTLRRAGLDAVGRRAGRVLAELERSTERLDGLARRFSGIDVRGVNDAIAGARRAARQLDEAVGDLRSYPAGFLFGGEPPPAEGLEPGSRGESR